MSNAAASVGPEWWVVCLCAEWCGVCREYRDRFAQVQADHPQVRFLWIDIEDESDLVDPVEVDNFPTLLLAAGAEPRFFGTIMPQAKTLERLVRTTLEGGPALRDPEVVALVARIRASQSA